MNDMLKWVFKDVTHDVIERERARLKSEGKLIEHKTPFGTITFMKSNALDDNELMVDGKLFKL